MKKGNKVGALVVVKSEIFKLFFKDAPEFKNTDITTITGEVVRDDPREKEIVIEFPGFGTRNLNRNNVEFIPNKIS